MNFLNICIPEMNNEYTKVSANIFFICSNYLAKVDELDSIERNINYSVSVTRPTLTALSEI
jgi:hypothetical protein